MENNIFAHKLRDLRVATGMSQQKMANLMLISHRTVSKWETGDRVPPIYVQRFVLNELAKIAAEKNKKPSI